MSRIATLLLTLIAVVPLAAQTTPPAAPAPGTSTAPEPEGFAALKWGVTVAQVNVVFPDAKCKTERPRKDGTVYSRCELNSFSIGTINGSATIDLVNDSFHRVLFRFPSGRYDEMKSLLLEKYGPTPRVENSSRREECVRTCARRRQGTACDVRMDGHLLDLAGHRSRLHGQPPQRSLQREQQLHHHALHCRGEGGASEGAEVVLGRRLKPPRNQHPCGEVVGEVDDHHRDQRLREPHQRVAGEGDGEDADHAP
ncbi:MAG: hypothetical protein QOE82_1346 [Thermoanaerobaculia bacterium]|nr:hypothetical protein [Thermoanaerobaculia bacterium]